MRTFDVTTRTEVVHQIAAEGSPHYEGGIDRRDAYDLLREADRLYQQVTGRPAEHDDSWWLVPTDDGVAIRFKGDA
jgi:hypothetical protein